MKKFLIPIVIMSLLTITTTAQAASNTNNPAAVKKLASEYVTKKLANQTSASNNILNEMFAAGASDIKIVNYKPCPYRGTLKIDGKSVNAKNKKCTVITYKYNNKNFEAGACKP